MAHDIRQSKRLSWLLRHGALEADLAMDAAGWCAVSDVLKYLRMSRETLTELVASNSKQRLQLDGEKIRASQGHSAGTPVTQDALEASWERWDGEAHLWHGTARAALTAIAEEGLTPQKRTHVHLTESEESQVAKRAHVEVVLEIDPAVVRRTGQTIFTSPNGVILARHVHVGSIVGLHPRTKATRRDEEALRALFGL